MSPGFFEHTIGVPLLVTPRAPSGEQNAPGLTPCWTSPDGAAGAAAGIGVGVGGTGVGVGGSGVGVGCSGVGVGGTGVGVGGSGVGVGASVAVAVGTADAVGGASELTPGVGAMAGVSLSL